MKFKIDFYLIGVPVILYVTRTTSKFYSVMTTENLNLSLPVSVYFFFISLGSFIFFYYNGQKYPPIPFREIFAIIYAIYFFSYLFIFVLSGRYLNRFYLYFIFALIGGAIALGVALSTAIFFAFALFVTGIIHDS